MAFSNIERSYHDVTMLDTATALGRVKDVMDISSSAEFFTIVKDPDSIKPTCKRLTFEGSTDFSNYMTPRAYYCIRTSAAASDHLESNSQTQFGARVRIRKMEFHPNCNLTINNEETGHMWTQDLDRIMHHCKAMWLYHNVLYFTPWFRNTSSTSANSMANVTQQFNNITSVYHAYINLSDVKNIEFELFELHPDSIISNGDSDRIFNIFNRIPSYNDYADKILLTQSPYNKFSISISNVRYDYIDTLIDLIDIIKECDGVVTNNAWWHRFIKDKFGMTFYNENAGTIANKFNDIDPGPMCIGDPVFYPNKYWNERLTSGDSLILFDNMNHHGATFVKELFSLFGISARIHTHSTQHLFEDITLKSITHSRNEELIIGNGDFWGDNDYEHNGIKIVESLSMDGHDIYNVLRLMGDEVDVNHGKFNYVTIGTRDHYIDASSRGLAVYGNATFYTPSNPDTNGIATVTVKGILNVEGQFKMPNVEAKTGDLNGTLHGMPILTISSDGTFYKTNFTFDTTKTTAPGNATPGTVSREFLGIDGKWRTIDSGYIGAAPSSHPHGNITSEGKITSDTAITSTTKLVATDGNGSLVRTPLQFSTGNNATTNKRNYLSQFGTFNTIKDLLFLSKDNVSNTNNYDNDNVLDDANNAKDPGVYRVKGGVTEHLPNITAAASYDNATFNGTTIYGILLTLTTDANTFTIAAGSTQRIIQILFNSSKTTDTNTKLSNYYIFIRSCGSKSNAAEAEWTNWTYFSNYDHNHDKEYAAIKEAKIATSIALYPPDSTNQQPATTDKTWYKETLTKKAGAGNDNLDYVLHSSEATFSSSATPGFKWAIQSSSNTTANSKYGFYLYRDGHSTDNAIIDYAAILNADTTVKGTLTVNSTSTFNDNVTIATGKSLTVGGTSTFNGNVSVASGKTLQVGGTNVSLEGHTHTKANLTSWLGFGTLRTGEVSWGTVKESNSYTIRWAADQTSGGGIAVGEKDGKTSIQVDGDIYINEGTTKLTGNTGTVTSISTSGTGLSGGTITGTGTITLNSSAEGNRTANQVVIAKANGQINSEKLAITSGATVKATMQYNSTEDCIDFIFA